MPLINQLDQDFKSALKNKDEIGLSVLRMIKTKVKNREKEILRPLQDSELISIITNQAKQRQDSIEQFTKGGRNDLVVREEAELKILEQYLPKRLTPEEIESEITGLVREFEATSIKDMGRIMKALMERHPGKLDGKQAGEIVKMKLREL